MVFNFNGNTPKRILYNGLNVIKLIYNGVVVWFKKTVLGIPPLTLDNSLGEDLIDYKIYGNSKQGELPEGYTQLEYIENNGTYIDTGLKATEKIKIEVEASVESVNQNGVCQLAGVVETPGFTINTSFSPTAGVTRFGNQVSSAGQVRLTQGQKYILSNSAEGFIIDGTTIINWNSEESFTTTNNIYVGSSWNTTIAVARNKMYYAKIYDDGVLIRHYIPCKNANNVIGMYDIINNTFNDLVGTPYSIGPVMPNPSSPIEIQSVGDKTKNLFDYNSQIWTTGLLSASNGGINENNNYKTTDYIELVEYGKNYTVSFNQTYQVTGTTSNRICYYNSNKTFISCNDTAGYSNVQRYSYNLNVPQNTKYIRYSVRNTDTEIQIEEGSTATDYEPYGYKIPIKIKGKNYLNENASIFGYISSSGAITSNSSIKTTDFIKVEKDKYYTFSYDYDTLYGTTSKNYAFYTNKDISSAYSINSYNPRNKGFTVQAPINGYIRISYYINLKEWQFEENTTPTSYEAYREPLTTNIYLDEPLRKIGDYADYIDYENQKVVRKIGNKVLNGTENTWEKASSTATTVRIPVDDYKVGENLSYYKCNKFKAITADTMNDKESRFGKIAGQSISNSNYVIFKLLGYTNQGNNITLWKNWLVNNNVEIIYPLATPTEESIVLPTIPTNEGTNIIEVDTEITPSNMEVKYYAKGVA